MSTSRFIRVVAVAGAAALAHLAPAQHEGHAESASPPGASQPGAAERPSDPFPLARCPVSGMLLGSMGDPVVAEYEGREVRFCCAGCVEDFEASAADYWKAIDKEIAEAQRPFYPLSTCLVSGEPLAEGGKDIGVDVVYRNRLVRFCCRDCAGAFRKDPEPVLAALDATVAAQQRESYPLPTCVVSGESLGEMGEPHEVVIANHLVRLCCAGCEEDLRASPLGALEALDKAWKARGMPVVTDTPAEPGHATHGHGEHGHHGEHGDHGGESSSRSGG